MTEVRYDWQEVVDLEPKGYLEIQDPTAGKVFHGPVERVSIDEDDFVRIQLKWAAEMGLIGTSTFGTWKYNPDLKEVTFPNLVVPFVLENTPEKGRRVRFKVVNIIYLNKVEGIDPVNVEGFPAEKLAEDLTKDPHGSVRK